MMGSSADGSRAKSALRSHAVRSNRRAARNDAVFHHFVQAGAELAARQRGEQRRIDDHGGGWMKRANQILAERHG